MAGNAEVRGSKTPCKGIAYRSLTEPVNISALKTEALAALLWLEGFLL